LRARGEAADNTAILSRYSILATAAVALILLSGIVNALFRVQGHIARFIATDYGEILLVKLLLVALMLALASYNRFIALPRLGPTKRQKIASNLAGSIGAELALGVIVIGAAALLGVTPPPN
jgi:copper resistance protein D